MTDFLRNEQTYLKCYKSEVEQKLNWGNSRDWRHHDFESLSQKIFEETGIMLSSTTLKRVWGKLKYESVPNTNTLNALAAFIGYENWMEFRAAAEKKQKRDVRPNETAPPVVEQLPTGKKKFSLKWMSFGLVAVVFIWFAVGFVSKEKKEAIAPSELDKCMFSSNPVADGIPNTVVFKYDVSHLTADRFAIQQSWNKRLQFEINKDRHEATSIYYYPGYFRAKLVVDDLVVKEHDLFIKSNGWLATLNRETQPRYFLKNELVNEHWLGLKESALTPGESYPNGTPLVMGYHYVDDFDGLQSDNFTLEASFKNTYSKGDGICQNTRIVILCTRGALIIPFSIPGCVGDLELMANDVSQEGDKHDLSAFGCDFSNWQKLKLKVQNREAMVSLNDQLIHQLTYKENAGEIAGMRFLFTGSGAVDDVRLFDEKGIKVFEERFD
ncbi:MAG: hypothetical protein AAFZ15_26060 [Bacteroidota bacterium]